MKIGDEVVFEDGGLKGTIVQINNHFADVQLKGSDIVLLKEISKLTLVIN